MMHPACWFSNIEPVLKPLKKDWPNMPIFFEVPLIIPIVNMSTSKNFLFSSFGFTKFSVLGKVFRFVNILVKIL